MDVKEFWNRVHRKNQSLWITGSAPESVYNFHSFPSEVEGKAIMEIGVGTGGSIKHLSKKNDVYAIDICEEALGRVSDISTVAFTKDMRTLGDGFIDLALCHLVFQHCDDDMVEFIISNVMYALREDGVFHFQFAHLPQEIALHKEIQWARDNGIMHFRTLAEMNELVERSGGVVSYCSDARVWPNSNNITWYMMQAKRVS